MASVPSPSIVDRTKIFFGPASLYLKVPVPVTGTRLTIDINGVPNPTAYAWKATTAYVLGQEVVDSNGNLQKVVIAGTSGASAPTWATTPIGALTAADGTVTWELVALNAIEFAGATQGAGTVTLTPKIEQVMADQVSGPIDAVMTQEANAIEIELKQSDLEKLQYYITHGTYASGTDTTLPENEQKYEEIAFGGIIPVPQYSVAVVAPRRDAAGKFVVAQLYNVFQAQAVALPYSREKETMYKVKLEGLNDPTRPVGDQAGKVYRQT